eukprot:GFUD01132846.1.p1 GENE.GFUD01132846.1~~GFUD01132846.1.p1  ORF type:complete len:335 (+),score=89.72 GFUD01132846.1:78-1082(+)
MSSERENLRMKWESAKRKLVKHTKNNENPETLERSKTDMTEKWELLMECQSNYLAQLTDDDAKNKERDEYADLDDKQDDIIVAADMAAEKKKAEMQIRPETAIAMRDKREVEAKRTDFQDQLGKIVVSKVAHQDYLLTLAENDVENWCEKSHCKIVYGIKPEFYESKFLGKEGLFQRASKLDDETLASFEMVLGAGGMEDQLKTFSTKPEKSGNKIGGRYGMYAATRRADESNNIYLIDVAYTVYEFEADLMGTGEKLNKWLKEGVSDQSATTKEDLITRLKLGGISALAENFIVSKALTAFAQSNVINKVKWLEDEDTTKQPTKQLELETVEK